MKYKLKKTYPGSPEVGTIYEENELLPGTWSYLESKTILGTYRKGPGNIQPKDYPEFWEEVREFVITSKEGKAIYNGGTYYTVYSLTPDKVFGPHTMFVREAEQLSSDFLYFTDKAVAEKYAYEHKAILCIQDINDAQQRWGGSYFPWTGLLNMAKDKLK